MYKAADLGTDWMVNVWAPLMASGWLGARRGNGVPASIEAMYQDALKDLKQVRAGQYQLDLCLREPAWPAWSNLRVDPRYRLRQLRVERPISENTPTTYAQNIDWIS